MMATGERPASLDLQKGFETGHGGNHPMDASPTYEELIRRCTELEQQLADRLQMEERWKSSEARFAAFMANLPAAVFIKDGESRYIYTNRFYEDVLGIREGLVGKTPDEIFPEKTARSMVADDNKVLSGRFTVREERMRDKDGKERVFQTHKFPIGGCDGPRSIGGFALDITAHKAADDALRKSEEKYRTHFENMSDVVYSLDPELRVLDVSPSVEKLLGYTADELVGKTYHELNILAPEYLEAAASDIMRVMQGETVQSTEYEFVTKNGERRFGELSGSPLRKDGMIVGLVSVARDITERKRLEEAIRKSESTLDRIFQTLPVGVGLMQDRIMQWHNNAMTRILGYTSEELHGENARMLYPDDEEFRRVGKAIDITRPDKAATRVETKWIRKDGSLVDCQVWYTLLDPESRPSLMVVMAEDISGRKRAEAERKELEAQLLQAQKMEAVGLLAGGVAHDFNNLLQAVLGYTQILLLDRERDDREFLMFKEIEKAARRASELTRQLLTFSRKVESKLRPVDLNNEVKQVRGLLERTLPKMVHIELDLQDRPWTIGADPSQVVQILMNLGVNAMDAMPGGGKLLFETKNVVLDGQFCSVHPDAKPGRYVLLNVSDTGVGIGKETVEHIFEPFFTTKEVGKGSGLGLAIVYGIVKNHGGCIIPRTQPGQGTAFEIYFPVMEEDGSEKASPGSPGL
jgi:two-component system cell cycle sensor histidine kinase/response regulator CckA